MKRRKIGEVEFHEELLDKKKSCGKNWRRMKRGRLREKMRGKKNYNLVTFLHSIRY